MVKVTVAGASGLLRAEFNRNTPEALLAIASGECTPKFILLDGSWREAGVFSLGALPEVTPLPTVATRVDVPGMDTSFIGAGVLLGSLACVRRVLSCGEVLCFLRPAIMCTV